MIPGKRGDRQVSNDFVVHSRGDALCSPSYLEQILSILAEIQNASLLFLPYTHLWEKNDIQPWIVHSRGDALCSPCKGVLV